jgi:hypothetical protein
MDRAAVHNGDELEEAVLGKVTVLTKALQDHLYDRYNRI